MITSISGAIIVVIHINEYQAYSWSWFGFRVQGTIVGTLNLKPTKMQRSGTPMWASRSIRSTSGAQQYSIVYITKHNTVYSNIM